MDDAVRGLLGNLCRCSERTQRIDGDRDVPVRGGLYAPFEFLGVVVHDRAGNLLDRELPLLCARRAAEHECKHAPERCPTHQIRHPPPSRCSFARQAEYANSLHLVKTNNEMFTSGNLIQGQEPERSPSRCGLRMSGYGTCAPSAPSWNTAASAVPSPFSAQASQ